MVDLKLAVEALEFAINYYLGHGLNHHAEACGKAIKILEQAQANGGALPPPVSTLVGKREKWV